MTTTIDTAAAVASAFASLRREGFLARQRFLCCGGCAGARLANGVERMSAARRAKVAGAVFFTRQDAAAFEVGRPTVEVGRALAAALRANGLEVEWDGNELSCVVVLGERSRRQRRAAAASLDSAGL